MQNSFNHILCQVMIVLLAWGSGFSGIIESGILQISDEIVMIDGEGGGVGGGYGLPVNERFSLLLII